MLILEAVVRLMSKFSLWFYGQIASHFHSRDRVYDVFTPRDTVLTTRNASDSIETICIRNDSKWNFRCIPKSYVHGYHCRFGIGQAFSYALTLNLIALVMTSRDQRQSSCGCVWRRLRLISVLGFYGLRMGRSAGWVSSTHRQVGYVYQYI